GPGCSSLIAVLQENGPLRWEPGTPAPTANPWSWNRLTDIVYVEFPVGVGFTQGEAGLLKNEEEAARELLGFWKGFVGLFGLRGKRILIAGESYGGYYVPDIAKAMLDEEDPEFFNVDGAFHCEADISTVPHRAMTLNFPHLFPFNTSFESELIALDERCGFTVFLNEFLVFPPRGIQPSPPTTANGCSIFETLTSALSYINPCFSTYQITATCPFPADPILNPPDGIEYFNRSDVQAAINAPRMDWEVCRLGVFDDNLDGSAPPNIEVLPHVIERLNKTLIVSGQLDLILPTNGTLLAIQNMTCNGALGFTSPPTQNQFFVPYAAIATTGPEGGFSATGVMGTTHAERGLTVFLAGHQIPHSSCHHPKHKTRRSTHKAERRGHKEPKVLKLVTRALKCAGRWLVNKNFTSTQ
ncbi:Alpha/Beta hydrolase protein, partial [Favolaschia claudopus]